jgi:molecular chaperone IbpA
MNAFRRAAASAYNSPRASLNSLGKTYFHEQLRPLPAILRVYWSHPISCPRRPSRAAHFSARPIWAGHPHVASKGGYAMRTFDLAPLYRSTVGFDRLFSLLDQGLEGGAPGYPPYNIERTGENEYRVSVAVAGLNESELSIVAKENTLTIRGEKTAKEEEKTAEMLYQGIAARTFERVFQLADFVQVKGASLENGLLHVDLVREIPEAKKPRSIPITGKAGGPTVIENKQAA